MMVEFMLQRLLKRSILLGMEKKAIQEKVLLRFYFGATINHITHSVSKLCWSFYSFK